MFLISWGWTPSDLSDIIPKPRKKIQRKISCNSFKKYRKLKDVGNVITPPINRRMMNGRH